MTGRERLSAILRREPTDRLSWSVLADDHTLSACPGVSFLDFCRQLGCDVFSLNGWGTRHGFASPALEWGEGVEAQAWTEGDATTWELRLAEGVLQSVWRGSHPVKYYVETLDDLRLYRTLWEGARYVPQDDGAAFAALDAEIGEHGVITRFWGPSTIPRLLETDIGVQSFYYLLHDHPEEMEALIGLVHEREMEAFEALARGPWESATLVENTSTYYISPDIYRRYNGPHVRDFVEAMHGAGKVAIIHMCGHVRNLLDQIRDTGADGVHALTPPPTGDTPWELALDALGEETIILGTLDPTVWVLGPVEGIGPALDRLITPRVRRAPFSLLVASDGICVPVERFEAVARWMEARG
jgi:hypothetical protein